MSHHIDDSRVLLAARDALAGHTFDVPVQRVLAEGHRRRRARRRRTRVAPFAAAALALALFWSPGGTSPAFADWSSESRTADENARAAVKTHCGRSADEALVVDQRGSAVVALFPHEHGTVSCLVIGRNGNWDEPQVMRGNPRVFISENGDSWGSFFYSPSGARPADEGLRPTTPDGKPIELKPAPPAHREGPMLVSGTVTIAVPSEDTAVAVVHGELGPEVARVEVRRAGGEPVQATISDGVFLAWWPTAGHPEMVTAFDAGGLVLQEQACAPPPALEAAVVEHDEDRERQPSATSSMTVGGGC